MHSSQMQTPSGPAINRRLLSVRALWQKEQTRSFESDQEVW